MTNHPPSPGIELILSDQITNHRVNVCMGQCVHGSMCAWVNVCMGQCVGRAQSH